MLITDGEKMDGAKHSELREEKQLEAVKDFIFLSLTFRLNQDIMTLLNEFHFYSDSVRLTPKLYFLK